MNVSRPLNGDGQFEDHIRMYIQAGRDASSKPHLMPTPSQPLELYGNHILTLA